MFFYCIYRVLHVIPVALGVVVAVALFIHLVPGDPVDTLLGEFATPQERVQLRERLGLHHPVGRQVLTYVEQVAHGDLGVSLIYNRPVAEMMGERLLPTLELAILAVLVALLLGVPMGILSALQKGRWIDTVSSAFSLVGVAMPTFWLGPMLVLLFSIYLGWLPVSERGEWTTYILPACTMGIALSAILNRMTRSSMLEHLKENYVRTARAKGCSEWSVIGKHVLRNAALPLVTVVGLQFGVLLTGAVITERVFDWPGVGSLMLEGLNNRDYPIVQGCVLLFSASYLLVNLLTDLVYAFVDPRIQLQTRSSRHG